jgi:hypothetical protein
VVNWFMKTASIKWKEFKSDLRKLYDDDMEDDELLALCDERVHEVDWKWLIDHWRSPEAAVSKRILSDPCCQTSFSALFFVRLTEI